MQFWHIVNTDILKSQVLHHLFNVYLTWLTQLYDLIFLCVISFPLHSFQSCLHSFGSFFFNCFFSELCFWLCVCVLSRSVMSNSLRPHELQPTRLLCPGRFFRKEYWSGLPCPPPGDLPNPGIEPKFPVLWADSLLSEPPDKPSNFIIKLNYSFVTYNWTISHFVCDMM